ncbi:MAG: hypothetical protein PHY15_06765 [Eubacteriales bacterium]|nr:hypothetical protein [Eubacteriales bacterium]
MDNPMIQTRKCGDGTWSVIAKVWNPQKRFYEHPTLINLTKEVAQAQCQEIIKQNPSIKEVIGTWEYIGD